MLFIYMYRYVFIAIYVNMYEFLDGCMHEQMHIDVPVRSESDVRHCADEILLVSFFHHLIRYPMIKIHKFVFLNIFISN